MHARRAATAVLLTVLALALLPGVATAHSELQTSDPTDGATLATPPADVTGDYSEAMDPTRSSMELRGPDGAQIAKGGVPADGPATRMTITGLPALAPGAYEVRWTTVTADDNGVERGTFTFTVAAAGASPAPSATAAASATPGGSLAPSAVASSLPSPTASPAPEPTPGTGAGDLLLPLLVLAAVLVGGAAVLVRRRR